MLKERLALLQKETGDIVTWDMERAEVLIDFFALVFTGKCSSHIIQVSEAEAGTGRMENHSHCRKSGSRPSKEPAYKSMTYGFATNTLWQPFPMLDSLHGEKAYSYIKPEPI